MTITYDSTVRQYLKDFQNAVIVARRGGVGSVEMATRPVVHKFVQDLIRLTEPSPRQVNVHHDTTVTPGNRPDWWIEDSRTFGVYAYGDHKDLSELTPFALSSSERSQMNRYLSLGRTVFVFDGIEFIFLDPNDADPFVSARRLSLVPKPLSQSQDWSLSVIDPQIENAFANILKNPGFRKWSESELIEQLAGRARLIADEIFVLLNAPRGSGADNAENQLLDSIHDLWKQLAQHHDPLLSQRGSCADFIAQVLVFGMFYAHTQAPTYGSSPETRHQMIRSFWTEDIYIDLAQQLRPFRLIASILGDSLIVQNGLTSWYRDAAGVLAHAEYVGTSPDPSDFHVLFEKFLAVFSPSIRFDYGTWYTPKSLTSWMIRFSDTLSHRSFGHGLVKFTEKVIDPCLGTGGFLEAYVNFAIAEGECTSELVGFEILPAPYALANYRLAAITRGTVFEKHLHLFLTDTLSDQISKPTIPATHGFDQEILDASSLASPPLRLVIGNPPSTNHAFSGSSRKIIEEKMEDFKPPSDLRTDRQNTQKAINNEAYRFLRWCADRVLCTDSGVLALVLPGSFVHTVSMRYARTWLKTQFSEVWVLELDEDARTGAATNSLFKVLQGRAVVFCVKGGKSEGIYHLSISHQSIAEKINFLEKDINLSDFVEINDNSDKLAPTVSYDIESWRLSWPLLDSNNEVGIFRLKCSGIKLGLTALFHTDKLQLMRRSGAIAKIPLSPFSEIRSAWFEGQRKPPKEEKLSSSVRRALGVAVGRAAKSVMPYTFRPFVRGFALIDDAVFDELVNVGGGGTRMRPEIRSAFSHGASALLIAPGPKDLGDSLTRFVSFAWDMPDNDNVSRGNAMVYCDRYPSKSTRKIDWNSSVASNTSSEIKVLFANSLDPDRDVLYYVYAVMSSPSYLSTFEPVLYVMSNPDQPFRVPFALDNKTRAEICELGKELASWENFEVVQSKSSNAAVTWPSGMSEFFLKAFKIDDLNESVELIGTQDESVFVQGFGSNILTHRISGYVVIERWLRERTFVYSRRTFRKSDLDEFIDLLSRIEGQLLTLELIDTKVQSIINDTSLLVGPSSLLNNKGKLF